VWSVYYYGAREAVVVMMLRQCEVELAIAGQERADEHVVVFA
jgi:hypothetical protein